ncbi:heptaprenylglyceryl phosphate synthase [Halegenticoccus soli]|uniref:heptaprenylglyceryl phosphate synthase n=1 Tax=Halegenticoccus soli TaxID=1985678 RepID=UPI0037427972
MRQDTLSLACGRRKPTRLLARLTQNRRYELWRGNAHLIGLSSSEQTGCTRVKIDPDESLPGGDTYAALVDTGTDALIIGGTTTVTEHHVQSLLDDLSPSDLELPVYIEPTYRPTELPDDRFTGYLIPLVLNAGDVTWLTGAHTTWVRTIESIDWEHTHIEAYIVLNPASAVATVTQATCDLTTAEIAAYAQVAEQLLGQDIIYLEYSGTLGDPALVVTVQEALSSATLFYGGGIDEYDSAYEMATVADTVVVGDLVHEHGVAALEETVRGAHDAKQHATSVQLSQPSRPRPRVGSQHVAHQTGERLLLTLASSLIVNGNSWASTRCRKTSSAVSSPNIFASPGFASKETFIPCFVSSDTVRFCASRYNYQEPRHPLAEAHDLIPARFA